MAKKKADVEMDITPMIDVTFMLIIFFIIVTEITSQDIEVLVLPNATAAKEDEEPNPDRLLVNIAKYADDALPSGAKPGAGFVAIHGKPYDFKANKDALVKLMRQEAWRANGKDLPVEDDGSSTREVLVRADRGVNYEYVQKFMQMVALDQKIRIYKLAFAIKKKQKE